MPETPFNESGLFKALLKGRVMRIPKNQIFQASDHRESLTLIQKGYVKRYSITNAGNESIQSIYGPNDIFPLTWVFKTLLNQEIYAGPEVFHYETLTDAVIYTINDEALKELVAEDPLIYRDLLYVAGQRFRSNIHNLENMSLANIEKRLAHQLYYYARFHGTQTTKGIKILFPLKQKQLGSMLDATRETVSVNLKLLREKKLIINDTYITVPDLKKLEEFAYN